MVYTHRMTNPHPLRAVLFDRDDTLTMTDTAVYREAALWLAQEYGPAYGVEARQAGQILAAVWQERGQHYQHVRTPEDERQFWAEYAADLTRRLGLPPEHAASILVAYPYERYLRAVPDAREVLTQLQRRGLKTGVLSNTFPSIDLTLQAVGLADVVDVALATCTLGVHKPKAGAFLLAAQALGMQAAEVLFVDDRPENVEAARQVGMRAELISLHEPKPGALHCLSDVLELV